MDGQESLPLWGSGSGGGGISEEDSLVATTTTAFTKISTIIALIIDGSEDGIRLLCSATSLEIQHGSPSSAFAFYTCVPFL